MSILVLSRDTVIKQTVQNTVEAGVITSDEVEMYTDELQQLNPKDLLTVFIESCIFRGQAAKPTDSYHVDIKDFCRN